MILNKTSQITSSLRLCHLKSLKYFKKSYLGQKASLKSRIRHTWAIQAKQALNTCGTGQLMHAKNVAATFWHFSRSILMDLRKPLFKPRPAWSWFATKYHNVLFPQYNINVISNVQLCRLEMAPLLNKHNWNEVDLTGQNLI